MNASNAIPRIPNPGLTVGNSGNASEIDKFRILEAASQKVVTSKGLIAHLRRPKTSIYRGLDKLIKAGHLERSGKEFRVTTAGQTALRAHAVMAGTYPTLEAAWSWLHLIPIGIYRAFIECVLFAVIARREGLGEDQYPYFFMVGPTQKLKSTTALTICSLTGADVKAARLMMPSVRRRGLLTRLDSNGCKTYENEALSEPIMWLEEVSAADPATKQDLISLIHGSKVIRVENQNVSATATLILESNPQKEEGSLEERLGFKAPQIRRGLILDLMDVSVSRKHTALSRAALTQIKKMGPALMPVPPTYESDSKIWELVEGAFSDCIKPEREGYADIGRINTLIAGARALLSPVAAAERVLANYFRIGATTGLVHADWQIRLDSLLKAHVVRQPFPESTRPYTIATAREEAASCAPAAALALPGAQAFAGTAPSTPQRNPYDLDENLLDLKRLLDKAGLRVPEDKETIAAIFRAAGTLREQGVRRESLPAMIRDVVPAVRFRRRMRELKISEANLPRLGALDRLLSENGLAASSVPEFLELHQVLRRAGFERKQAESVAQALQEARAEGRDRAAAAKYLLEAASEGQDLFAQNRDLADRRLELAAQNAESAEQLQRHLNLLQRQSAVLEKRTQKLRTLRADCDQLIEEREQALNELQKLVGDIHTAKESLQEARVLERTLTSRSRAIWLAYLALFDESEASSPQLLEAIKALCHARLSGADAERVQECTEQILDTGADLVRNGPIPADEIPQKVKQLMDLQEQLAKCATALAQLEGELDAQSALNPLLAIFRAVLFPKRSTESNVELLLLLQKVCRLLQVRQETWREGMRASRFAEQVTDVVIHAMGMGLIKRGSPTPPPAREMMPVASPPPPVVDFSQLPITASAPVSTAPMAPGCLDIASLFPKPTSALNQDGVSENPATSSRSPESRNAAATGP